jgi:TetR/AcrR family transcriptional regulator
MGADRDLNRAREKMLSAALVEFSAKGLAGARTSAIARRAGVDERMIFYCFKTRKTLCHEAVRRKLTQIASIVESSPDEDFPGKLVNGYEANCVNNASLVRMLEWEALGAEKGKLVAQQERRALLRAQMEQLRRQKLRGELAAEVDEEMLLIASIAMRVFPLALPQLTWLISGLESTDPRFMRKWCKFLRWLGERIAPYQVQAASVRRTNEPGTKAVKTEREATCSASSFEQTASRNGLAYNVD